MGSMAGSAMGAAKKTSQGMGKGQQPMGGMPDFVKNKYASMAQARGGPAGGQAGISYNPGTRQPAPFLGRGASVYRAPQSTGGTDWRSLLAGIGGGNAAGGRRGAGGGGGKSRFADLMAAAEAKRAAPEQSGGGRRRRGFGGGERMHPTMKFLNNMAGGGLATNENGKPKNASLFDYFG